VSGSVHVARAAGDHNTMLVPPHVLDLVRQLDAKRYGQRAAQAAESVA
jgi:hypothetical protein